MNAKAILIQNFALMWDHVCLGLASDSTSMKATRAAQPILDLDHRLQFQSELSVRLSPQTKKLFDQWLMPLKSPYNINLRIDEDLRLQVHC